MESSSTKPERYIIQSSRDLRLATFRIYDTKEEALDDLHEFIRKQGYDWRNKYYSVIKFEF